MDEKNRINETIETATETRSYRKNKRKERRISILSKVPSFCVGLVVGGIATFALVVSLVGFGAFLPDPKSSESITTVEIEHKIEACKNLTITKVSYAGFEVVDDEKEISTPLGSWPLPFTDTTLLVAYKGEIGLGFDISEIESKIDTVTKRITLKLPNIGIQYNVFNNDETKSYEIKTSVFNPISFDLSNQLIAKIKQAEASKILENETDLQEARQNAERVIKEVILSWDVADGYEIIFE